MLVDEVSCRRKFFDNNLSANNIVTIKIYDNELSNISDNEIEISSLKPQEPELGWKYLYLYLAADS
jgi:hypothetical protein